MDTISASIVNRSRLAAGLGILVFLTACGGGGGGTSTSTSGGSSGGSAANGSSTGNASTSGSSSSGTTAAPDGAISTSNTETIIGQVLAPVLLSSIPNPGADLAQLQASARSTLLQPRGVETAACKYGGTYTMSFTDNGAPGWSSGDIWSYAATNCRSLPAGTENGQITWQITNSSGSWDSGGPGTVAASVTFNHYKVTDTAAGEISETDFYGVLSYSQTTTTTATDVVISGSNLTISAVESGLQLETEMKSLNQRLAIKLADNSYTSELDCTLRLESTTDPSVNGTYTIGVKPALRGVYNRSASLVEPPYSGVVTIVGPNRAKIVLTAQTGGTVKVAVDSNADGIADWTDNAKSWDDLVPN